MQIDGYSQSRLSKGRTYAPQTINRRTDTATSFVLQFTVNLREKNNQLYSFCLNFMMNGVAKEISTPLSGVRR